MYLICVLITISDNALYLYVIGIVRQYKPSLDSALPGMFKCLYFAMNKHFLIELNWIEGGLSKTEPNANGSLTFDPHVGLVIPTVNQI